jgi:hypothetical protein
MAETSQLQKIAGLVEQLEPLGAKAKGMRIEAEEWNALIGVLGGVLEVERVHERTDKATLDETTATRDRLEVIDGELQARLGENGGSMSKRLALSDVEKKVESLGTEVGRLTAVVEGQQALIDRSSVDELERANALRGFEDRFKGVEDLRGVVTTLSAAVDGVRGGVETVLELRKELTDPQGNPIDVTALRDDLIELEALRDNLLGVDGQLLRLRDLEVQIVELQDAVGVGGGSGLDARIAAALVPLEATLAAKVEGDVDVVRAALEQQVAAARAELQGSLDATLATTRAELEQAATARADATDARVDEQLAAARTALDAQVAELKAGVEASVPETVKAAVEGALADLDGRIAVVVSGQLEQRLSDLPQLIAAQVNERAAALREELAGLWRSELADASGKLEEELKRGLDEFGTRGDRKLEEVFGGVDSRLKRLEDAVFGNR